ncbi:MAG: FtsX-like permease family protein [Acidimicrobiales bacterium]
MPRVREHVVVTRQALGVCVYRFRTTVRRRRAGYLALVVLLGLVGGLAMGAVAAARRTQSSFPLYMASTHPPDLFGITAFVNPTPGVAGRGYDAPLVAAIARLPHVTEVGNQSGLNIIPLGPHGAPLSPASFPASAGEAAGLDENFSYSHVGATATSGRLPRPTDAHAFVTSATTARLLHFHVGESVTFGVYTNAQTNLRAFGTARVVPHERFRATMVGIVLQSTAVVEDDVDVPNNANILAFPPARAAPLLSCCAYYTGTEVKVDGTSRAVAEVQARITALLPPGFSPFTANPAPAIVAKAERAIKPESIALGVFGAFAALAALLIAAQMIGRQVRLGSAEVTTLRALGADPAMTVGDGLVGILGAVVLGAFAAAVVAVALSPLSPLGPARPVYPTPGVAFDWTVLGSGVAVLVVVLGAVGLFLAYRNAPHRASARRRHAPTRPSTLADSAAAIGLSPAAVTGVRFAVEPGGGEAEAVPVRSAMLGATLAIVIVVATVTFGASLNALVSHPALYGWNWDYELTASQGGVMPGARSAQLLDHDHEVAAWNGILFDTLRVGDLPAVAAIAERAGATVAPPVLSGHGVERPDQIVLGAVTLGQLHAHLGETVTVSNGATRPVRLRIVGTATMPTIGVGGNQHPEMGTGALVANRVLPATSSTGYSLPGAAPGPDAILVRLAHGVSAAAGRRSLQRIAASTSTPADYGVVVDAVQRPAEIVNYRSMGATPAILGAGLAAGAVAALGLTLMASVRRRRRDLALLKTLGFTQRQLASVVAWQSSVAVVIGAVVGIPLGIVLGRTLWDLFAREISAVPAPSVPVVGVVVIGLGSLVLANLIAAVPGRVAARTSTDVLLRAE